jgi:hypothetical protein
VAVFKRPCSLLSRSRLFADLDQSLMRGGQKTTRLFVA